MKKIFATVAVILLLTIVSAYLFACTPPVYEGISIDGASTDSKDIPLTVQSCKITLNVTDLPEESDEPQQYRSTATIDYRFYNPTDNDVDIPLHLPINKNPYYKDSYQLVYGDTTLTVDGNPVDVVTRCWYGYDSYDRYNEFLLPEGRLADDYFNDDLVIYAYLYKIELPFDDDRLCMLEYTLDENDKVVINRDVTDYQNHYFADTVTYYTIVKSNDIITMYSFGKQMSELTFNITETRDGKKIDNAEIEQIAEFQNTFEDVALMYYNPNGRFVSSDWYNAVLKKLQWRGVSSHKSTKQFDVTDDVRTWYDYTITVPAHGTVNHSVTMPIFPYIHYDYTPDVYWYFVDLGNFKSYADVGEIDISVNTDFYPVGDSETVIHAQGIKEQSNWRFELCSVAEPSDNAPSSEAILTIVILANVLPEAIALTVVIIVAVKTSPQKRKQAEK